MIDGPAQGLDQSVGVREVSEGARRQLYQLLELHFSQAELLQDEIGIILLRVWL